MFEWVDACVGMVVIMGARLLLLFPSGQPHPPLSSLLVLLRLRLGVRQKGCLCLRAYHTAAMKMHLDGGAERWKMVSGNNGKDEDKDRNSKDKDKDSERDSNGRKRW